jgi:hypothetical protein
MRWYRLQHRRVHKKPTAHHISYGTNVVEVKDAERSQQGSDRSGIRSPPFGPTFAQRRERCQLSPWLLNAQRVLR